MSLLSIFNKVMLLNDQYIHLENDASYAVVREGSLLGIYFQWSNGKTDWKSNFKFAAKSVVSMTKPYKDLEDKWRAHRGFLENWKIIEEHVKDAIMDPEVNTIVIAGYSHGAGIALLCHEYCKYHRPDISDWITGYGFGAPRVVWGRVGKRVKERFKGFTVIRNCRDIVTHVPPRIFGYRHVGKMVKIGKDAKYNCIDSHRDSSIRAELERHISNPDSWETYALD